MVLKLLEATLGRILELKSDLVEADLNEFTYCGDIFESLKVTPLETELIVPACFRNNRNEEIKQRKEAIEDVLGKLGFLEKKVKKVITNLTIGLGKCYSFFIVAGKTD